MPANAETDPMFTLLTDALREGPGSAPWQDAVARLRESGAREHDEYRLLIDARQNLEDGKEYRAVRAGAGFTRKLMDQLDDAPPAGTRQFPLATLIAIVCGIAIVAVLGFLIYRVVAPPAQGDRQAVEQLAAQANTFFTDIETASFDSALPANWKQIGSLPLDLTNGLHPAAGNNVPADAGGGAYWLQPLPADKEFTLEVRMSPQASAAGYATEVFVANSNQFNTDRGTSPGELTWLFNGNDQQVVVDGHVVPIGSLKVMPSVVRITMGTNVGLVEVYKPHPDGSGSFVRVWSGAHHLGQNGRYVGVRFLRTGAQAGAASEIKQVKVVGK